MPERQCASFVFKQFFSRDVINRNRRFTPHASNDEIESKTTKDREESQQTSPLDPVSIIQYGGTLPSPRRVALGGFTALSIALGGNLFGITSFLLGLDGGNTAQQLHLDVLVPVKGYKRCIDYQNGYGTSWLI